jgi:putative DNA primase/helicase
VVYKGMGVTTCEEPVSDLPESCQLLDLVHPERCGFILAMIGPKGLRQRYVGRSEKIEEVVTKLARLQEIERGIGVYYSLGSLSEKPSGRGKEQDVSSIRCCYADVDKPDKASAHERIESFVKRTRLAPSVLIDSGGGWQCLWLLREPIKVGPFQKDAPTPEALRVRAINAALARELEGDRTIDLARVFRLPGTFNTKCHDPEKYPDYTTPLPCRIVKVSADRYTLEDLEWIVAEEDRRAAGRESAKAERPKKDKDLPPRSDDPSPPEEQPPAGAADDETIIERASRSRKSGEKFRALWAGRWNDDFPSASEADSSLVFTLAFYTKDAAQLDRIFRRSGLMRDKWDEQHGAETYGQRTIRNALEHVTAQYAPTPCQVKADDGEWSSETVPLGEHDPATGRLVLSPTRTLPTAEVFVREFHARAEGRTIHSWTGPLFVWQGNRYAEIEDGTLRNCLFPWLHDALRYLTLRNGALILVPFQSNPGTVSAALESIRALVHLPVSVTPPVWLDGGKGRPEPREILPCYSMNLHIPTGKIIPATPALFAMNALDFDFDPGAPQPIRWLEFLDQLWGDDAESVGLLQEWFAYCLIVDTSQQKMLLLVGPRRSGKGTVGRVLTRLVGMANVCGPTISSLAGPFGLQPLIGKNLAVVSDARFSGKDLPTVVERLLCISGEDVLTIDRKYLGSVTMRLSARMMFLTNELPRFSESSGALAGRFLTLRLAESFYGREDKNLTEKLCEELPGILLWAIEGWRRLNARGRFVQPQSAEDAVRELEDLSSPVGAFVRHCCNIGPGFRVWVDDLYEAWRMWCGREGWNHPTAKATFGRDLAAAVPGIAHRRGTGDKPFYEGLDLKLQGGGA